MGTSYSRSDNFFLNLVCFNFIFSEPMKSYILEAASVISPVVFVELIFVTEE